MSLVKNLYLLAFISLGAASSWAIEGPMDWEYRTAQNGAVWTAWKKAEVGHRFPRNFQGYIEYRSNFSTETGAHSALGVYLGQIGDADKVWINGELIGATGEFPPRFQPNLGDFREYLIPDHVLKSKNELRVETYVEYVGRKGLSISEVEIGPHNKLQNKKILDGVFWYSYKAGLPILLLFLSIISMPWWSTRGQFWNHVLLSMVGVSYAIFGVGRSRAFFPFFELVNSYKIVVLSALTGMTLIYLYAFWISKVRRKWLYFIFIALPLICAVRIGLAPDMLSASHAVEDWFYVSMPLNLTAMGIALFYARKESLWVRIGISLVAVIAMYEILLSLRFISGPNLMDVTFCGFVMAMLMNSLAESKKGWLELSAKKRDLIWSQKFLKLARQVAHDIRSPLSSMESAQNNVEYSINKNIVDAAEIKKSLEIKRLSIERLKSISSRLLKEYGSMFNDRSTSSQELPKLTLLDKLVFDVILETKSSLDTSIDIKTDGFAAIPEVWSVVVPGEIQTAISNILRNAVEAVSYVRKPEIKVQLATEENKIVIEISNNGPIIPSDERETIFKEGFTTKEIGTGLGLAQAKQAVERNKGSIELESTQERTTFRVVLEKENSPSWIDTKIDVRNSDGLIFVDDDHSMLAYWKNKLEHLPKGMDARYLSSISAIPVDGIASKTLVLDYHFKDGKQTGIEWFKGTSDRPKTYLCTTAYDDPEIQEFARSNGVVIVPKPAIEGVRFLGME